MAGDYMGKAGLAERETKDSSYCGVLMEGETPGLTQWSSLESGARAKQAALFPLGPLPPLTAPQRSKDGCP